ncbi:MULTISPECIES: serine/threonine-protein kinase [unclassified Nocardia]|uniref:serine/threonine-protein kinase n=1 Tax=unclassified Nocardia TaxID=2637762 RepID=UPI001CE43F27|nr:MULTISPECIES: serine/threonine-protein kinase [unclassified Nocardia]
MTGPRVGEVFAGYRIEGVLGRGGMGTVYRARHPRLPRLTALKLLNPEYFGDKEVRQRFEREADLVAQLEHPNIVTVYDRGNVDPYLWISMQYVAGTDAASLGATDPFRAVRIIGEAGAALDYAHQRGVLHRDVKPANILLADDISGAPERVFLADFGIARLRDETNGLTGTGAFTATLAYAAPEQLSGAPLDQRCDQYSLACSLYALLTGSAPFVATNPVAVINAQMYEPPPPLAERRAGLPTSLDVVLAGALSKRADDRYRTCGEFADAALHALQVGTQPTQIASHSATAVTLQDSRASSRPVLHHHSPTAEYGPPNRVPVSRLHRR